MYELIYVFAFFLNTCIVMLLFISRHFYLFMVKELAEISVYKAFHILRRISRNCVKL